MIKINKNYYLLKLKHQVTENQKKIKNYLKVYVQNQTLI